MLNQYKTKKDEGFTIIEVMIVLAIAGLIMLIVFLAVPALQRSSRNTQRKTDANNALSALSDYISNNGGALPTAACSGTGCPFEAGMAKLGYYQTAKVAFKTSTSSLGTPTSEDLWLVGNAQCTSQAAAPTAGTSPRQFVAYYGIEPGNTTQCVEG
ncbi:MAG TPA: type II secretion system protein [Candidatus Saccharimonadales bacterium]|nr:type II secretion system protein [Candidatus Saccharimonadales bacterium]